MSKIKTNLGHNHLTLAAIAHIPEQHLEKSHLPSFYDELMLEQYCSLIAHVEPKPPSKP